MFMTTKPRPLWNLPASLGFRRAGFGQTPSVSLFDQIMAYAQAQGSGGGGDVMNLGQFCQFYKAVTGRDCPPFTSLAVFGINQTSAYPLTFLIQAVQSAGASAAPAPVPVLSPMPVPVSLPPLPSVLQSPPPSPPVVSRPPVPTVLTPAPVPVMVAPPASNYLRTAESVATTSFTLPVWALALGAGVLFLSGRRGR